MRRITESEIDSLRRRLQLPGGQAASSSPRPARREGRAVPGAAADWGIEGREQVTKLGSFLLQERFYASDRSHGNLPISCLQGMPCDAGAVHAIGASAARSADAKRWAFLDTETTGLAGGTGTCAFLVGVGTIEDGGFRVKLHFMRDFDEEHAMLEALARRLDAHDTVVTFNGKTFDVPLLETRYRLKRLRSPFGGMQHLDLLHPARKLWKERLGSCRLARLESAVLGFERKGDIPGALIPQRYFDYLRSRDGSRLGAVFHHNALDIVSLACLSSVLLTMLAAPGRAKLHHGRDILGLARWLGQLGQEAQALGLYRKAVQAGLPRKDLFAALWETARLERRAGRYEQQARLLRDLARASPRHRAAAFVELAKHYEHRRKDYTRALQMTRSAQRHAPAPELCHRERRILRKLSAAGERDEEGAVAPAAASAG